MEDVTQFFNSPLRPDPAVQLLPVTQNMAPKTGPLHKVQFVIEFVGPRSLLASDARRLLDPEYYNALGRPQIFAMRPADLLWSPLTSAQDGSYDSLALAWDYLTAFGNLSSSSAAHLFVIADKIGPTLQRRPMPMPQPADVDQIVEALSHSQELLDIGFAINVVSEVDYHERDIWVQCARLGLEYSPEGSFDWRSPNQLFPLLSVTPFGQQESFSLAAIKQDVVHAGITIGFNMPRCVAPKIALDGAFHVAKTFVHALGGAIYTDDERPMTSLEYAHLGDSMNQAMTLFSQIGLTPGSPECLKLFPA